MFGRKRERAPLPPAVTNEMVEQMLDRLYPGHERFGRLGLTADKADWRGRIRRGLEAVFADAPKASPRRVEGRREEVADREVLIAVAARELGGCDEEVCGNTRRADSVYHATAERVVDAILAALSQEAKDD